MMESLFKFVESREGKMKKYKKQEIIMIICFMCITLITMFIYINDDTIDYKQKEKKTSLTKTSENQLYSLMEVENNVKYFPTLYKYSIQRYENKKQKGTYIIPGLEATRTLALANESIAMCTSMTPQGITTTEKYILITAYCYTQQHNSVIYVVDKETHKFVKEIILEGIPHSGGIAYDKAEKNIWVCSNQGIRAEVISFSLDKLEQYDITKTKKSYRV